MMHASFEEALAMKSHPQANRPEFVRFRKWLPGEIDRGFLRAEVHIAKCNEALHGLFEDLGPPASLGASVITFPSFKAEDLQRAHQIDEMASRRPEGMMVMVRPAEAKFILARFL